jgi:hypothetical protein
MPKTTDLADTFAKLRRILAAHRRAHVVAKDTRRAYQLSSRTLKDRAGQPLFVAAVSIKKNYVSYYLMPVYAVPQLLKKLSPGLQKRMQGKSCFNFTTVQAAQLKELAALTRAGIKAFAKIKLPWA